MVFLPINSNNIGDAIHAIIASYKFLYRPTLLTPYIAHKHLNSSSSGAHKTRAGVGNSDAFN